MEEYTDEQVAQDIFATLDSIGIVERVRLIPESDRTDDQKDELSRNERQIQIKMKNAKIVNSVTKHQAEKIKAIA